MFSLARGGEGSALFARQQGRELKADAIGASIGIYIGLAFAGGLTSIIEKTGLDIAEILQQALVYVT